MIDDNRLDLTGDRWVAFIRSLPFINANFTGATFLMHIRLTKDLAGVPLINLGVAASAAVEGVRLADMTFSTIAAHIAYGRLQEAPEGTNPATGLRYALGDEITISTVGIRINETTIEVMPFPGSGAAGERGDDLTLFWDLHITPSGGTKDRYAGGKFIVRAGVTQ